MNKTLADFKKDLVIGKKIILKQRGKETTGSKLGITRYVIAKNTVDCQLSTDPNATQGSHLRWPKASLLSYDGKNVITYQAGQRPLTAEEQTIRKNEPQDPAQDQIDMMSDGSTMFFRRKQYYLEHKKFYYLFGVSTESGKRLIGGTRKTIEDGTFSDWAIIDDNIKGEIDLVYEIL